jgi:hypothetical protein
MVNKKFWLGMLVMVVVFGMTVVGCEEEGPSPSPSPSEVTVTFDANGGKWDDNSTTKTAKVTKGASQNDIDTYVRHPTRQGYEFLRWTTNPNADPYQLYLFTVYTDTTVYACWRSN